MAATMLAAPRYGVEDFETMSIRSAAPSYSTFPFLAYATRGSLVSLAEAGRGGLSVAPNSTPPSLQHPGTATGIESSKQGIFYFLEQCIADRFSLEINRIRCAIIPFSRLSLRADPRIHAQQCRRRRLRFTTIAEQLLPCPAG
jgi:hypothetical protein